MANSMISSTNYKKKCVSSSLEPYNNTSFNKSDWINTSSLDFEDFIYESSYSYENDYNNSFYSSPTSSKDLASNYIVHENLENLSSKKRKTMEVFIDQELEDTATSPIQSPKVNDYNLLYVKLEEMDNRDVSLENENTRQLTENSTNMSLLLDSELRKKGLCLIPTSMLLNYLTANII